MLFEKILSTTFLIMSWCFRWLNEYLVFRRTYFGADECELYQLWAISDGAPPPLSYTYVPKWCYNKPKLKKCKIFVMMMLSFFTACVEFKPANSCCCFLFSVQQQDAKYLSHLVGGLVFLMLRMRCLLCLWKCLQHLLQDLFDVDLSEINFFFLGGSELPWPALFTSLIT